LSLAVQSRLGYLRSPIQHHNICLDYGYIFMKRGIDVYVWRPLL